MDELLPLVLMVVSRVLRLSPQRAESEVEEEDEDWIPLVGSREAGGADMRLGSKASRGGMGGRLEMLDDDGRLADTLADGRGGVDALQISNTF